MILLLKEKGGCRVFNSFLISEAKKWLRDPMTAFMVVYPILFGVIGRWIVPWIADTSGYPLEAFADIVLVALTLMAPHIYGALIGFSILDDRDDHILTSVKVTPLSVFQFLAFRLCLGYLLAFATVVYVILFSNLASFTLGEVLLVATVSALSAPMVGLLINAFAKNKIEGFAVMKGIVSILIIFPIAALFFSDAKQWFFAFTPGFWPAKSMSVVIHGVDAFHFGFYGAIVVGLIYTFILNMAVYTWFKKKTIQ